MRLDYKKKYHILCIDDDDKIRKLISKFLYKNNFLVSAASSAFDARVLLDFYIYDLIILDIMIIIYIRLILLIGHDYLVI